MRIRLHGEYQPRQPGFVTNSLLRVILHVDMGGYTFNVYGSMSWTMGEVAKLPWEQIRAAYVELTGDARDDVNSELATRVVKNALQEAWALYTRRDDIVERVAQRHGTDIEVAVTTTPHQEEQVTDQDTAPTAAEDQQATEGTTTEEATPKGNPKIPTRGAMGRMHQLLKEGIQDEEEILRVLRNEYPSAKQLQRNLRYVARITGFKLIKMAKTSTDAPANDAAPAPEA